MFPRAELKLFVDKAALLCYNGLYENLIEWMEHMFGVTTFLNYPVFNGTSEKVNLLVNGKFGWFTKNFFVKYSPSELNPVKILFPLCIRGYFLFQDDLKPLIKRIFPQSESSLPADKVIPQTRDLLSKVDTTKDSCISVSELFKAPIYLRVIALVVQHIIPSFIQKNISKNDRVCRVIDFIMFSLIFFLDDVLSICYWIYCALSLKISGKIKGKDAGEYKEALIKELLINSLIETFVLLVCVSLLFMLNANPALKTVILMFITQSLFVGVVKSKLYNRFLAGDHTGLTVELS